MRDEVGEKGEGHRRSKARNRVAAYAVTEDGVRTEGEICEAVCSTGRCPLIS